ncbi:MAG TPA: glycoside hydrolase family 9 protein [Clostridia bacterium]
MGKGKFLSKKKRALLASFVSIATVVASVNTVSLNAATPEYNYAKALQYSQFFYDANMCGTDVSKNTLYGWRSDCHTYDAKLPLDSKNTNMTDSFISQNKSVLDPDGDGTVDVSGGFHDAGDHVKFGMPQAYSGATLGWAFYEFKKEYETTGQDKHAKTILRYFNDFFMRSTFLDSKGKMVAFCYQVGDGDVDHAYWEPPENDDMFRRGWFATSANPSTDCTAETAASLAANYMNFKDEDPTYAEKSLKYAKALFDFAKSNDKKNDEDGPKGYYASGKWQDDYCWAAGWLYLATKDDSYLDELFKYYDYYAPSCWTHCWNDVNVGATCILAEINDSIDKDGTVLEDKYKKASNKSPYETIEFWSQIAKLVDNWMNGTTPKITPGGYAFLNQWGSARYNTATQFAALVYDKHHGDKASKYGDWAKAQMQYLMGNNPINRCYIVGYSDISAKFPHHRAASGLSRCEDPSPQKHVLYGALVGGPGASDEHKDVTSDYIYNEVTIDYNAAFVGACAGLYHFYGDSSMTVTPDFPPKETDNGDNGGGGNSYWVNAFGVDIKQSDGPKATEVTFFVNSDAKKPSKNVSVRYFFDATGMTSVDPNNIELRQLYDQTAAETTYKATLSGPTKYKDNIYYVQVSWDGYAIAGSNKKYQFALGTYAWGNSWNPTDDWSHKGLKIVDDAWTGATEKTDHICVYDNGVLVGGVEPDGSTPVPPSSTPTPKPTVTPTPTSTSNPQILPGDLNDDKKINSTDASILKRIILGTYTGTYNAKNADVNSDGKINSTDYSKLKRIILGTV